MARKPDEDDTRPHYVMIARDITERTVAEAELERHRSHERIAQMVVATHIRVRLVERKQARATVRGDGGFGSTGTRTKAGAVPGKPSPKRSPGKAAKPVTSSVANRKAVAAKAKPTKPRRR